MKSKTTQFLRKNSLALSILIALTFIALSASTNSKSDAVQKNDLTAASIMPFELWNDLGDGPKKFSFFENDIHWDVTLDDGKITELIRNGEVIPSDEIENYEDKVFDKLAELYDEVESKNSKTRKFSGKFHFDFDGMKSFKFNSEEFREEMQNLAKELQEMKDIKIDIEWDDRDFQFDWDSDKFKEEMSSLKESLKELDNMNFDFDFESIPNKIEIEMEGLDEAMDMLADELGDLEIDLSELEVEMEKLTDFIDAMEDELVSDGYLESDDEDFELELTTDKMEVNGEKLPEDLHKKYLELYEKHYGKNLDEPFRIQKR